MITLEDAIKTQKARHIIKLRASRRIGELSRDLDIGWGNQYVDVATLPQAKKQVLAEAGISKQDASRFEAIANLDDDV